MKIIGNIFKCIWKNKEWIFSGIGVTIFTIVFPIIINKVTVDKIDDSNVSDTINQDNGSHIEIHGDVDGNVYQNSIINNFSGENNNISETTKSDHLLQDGKKIEENQVKKELVIDVDGDVIYPISIDIKDEQKVGDWVYFIYKLTESSGNYTIEYPVLFRYKADVCIAERVSPRACYSYDVAKDCVFYIDSTMDFQDHGELYISRPDGKNERILEEELYDFQIVDEKYIYFTYRHDTVGVGLEGHALYRMNLDGSDIMIVAYEVLGIDMNTNHRNYKVEDGWVDCGKFKIEIGEPADGFEKLVFYDIGDNDWVYYTTNRLIKARKDGSEIMELDGVEEYYYCIEKIEDSWIYYTKGVEKYKIRTDGSGKELIGYE